MNLSRREKNGRGTRLAALSFSIAMVLAALSAFAGPPPGAPTDKDPNAYKGMTKEQIAQVKNGEIVIFDKPETVDGRQMITAAMMFNQDLETTWKLLTARERQEEYLPNLKRSKMIKSWPDGGIIQIEVVIMGISIEYQTLGKLDRKNYKSTWTLNPGYDNDMKEVSGFFHFYYVDDKHTLARYGSFVELGIWVPAAAQNYLTRTGLPDSLAAQKKWVDSNGTYRKEGYVPPKD